MKLILLTLLVTLGVVSADLLQSRIHSTNSRGARKQRRGNKIRGLWRWADADKDQNVDPAELEARFDLIEGDDWDPAAEAANFFTAWDTDAEGVLSRKEWRAAWKDASNKDLKNDLWDARRAERKAARAAKKAAEEEGDDEAALAEEDFDWGDAEDDEVEDDE